MTQSLVSKLLAEANKIYKTQMRGNENLVSIPYFYSDLSAKIRKELRKLKIENIFIKLN